MENYKEVVILIAEDDDGHAELIKRGLIGSGVKNKLVRFSDGEETWNYLTENKNKNQYNFLLLLDINMPRMDGIEVLANIKGDAHLKEMPVIMLTTTDDPREVEECYKLGCNVYVTKPVEFISFSETLKRLGLFLQVIKV